MSAGVLAFNFKVRGQEGSIPAVGLGTVALRDETCKFAVAAALSCSGCSMIDAALLYGNQESVGEAIRSSGASREDVFVTTKVAFSPPLPEGATGEHVWQYDPSNAKNGNVAEAIDVSLKQLGLEYVDLLLVHSPCASVKEHGSSCLPHFLELFGRTGDDPLAIRPERLPDGSRTRDIILTAKRAEVARECNREQSFDVRRRTSAAMERALGEGKCRYIGVSNYPLELQREMETYPKVMPAVDQVELHPWFARSDLVEAAREMGMVITAYGSGNSLSIRQERRGDDVEVLNDIATRVGRTPMQVVLRWTDQRGVSAIPRSSSPQHVRENADIFSWEQSAEDMKRLDALDEDHPYYWDPEAVLATIDETLPVALVKDNLSHLGPDVV